MFFVLFTYLLIPSPATPSAKRSSCWCLESCVPFWWVNILDHSVWQQLWWEIVSYSIFMFLQKWSSVTFWHTGNKYLYWRLIMNHISMFISLDILRKICIRVKNKYQFFHNVCVWKSENMIFILDHRAGKHSVEKHHSVKVWESWTSFKEILNEGKA